MNVKSVVLGAWVLLANGIPALALEECLPIMAKITNDIEKIKGTTQGIREALQTKDRQSLCRNVLRGEAIDRQLYRSGLSMRQCIQNSKNNHKALPLQKNELLLEKTNISLQKTQVIKQKFQCK